MARALEVGAVQWLAANAEDVKEAEANGMRPAMLDRLRLTEQRVADIVAAVRQVIALPDPIGRVTKMETRPNGLQIGRKTVPLGVIAIIYEARPNVTVDAAALCLKSGNVCILRGGKEAIRSNTPRGGADAPARWSPWDCRRTASVSCRTRAARAQTRLMHLNGYVDVLIPRGGAGLIRAVARAGERAGHPDGRGRVPHLCGFGSRTSTWRRRFCTTRNARARRCATRWNAC